MAIDTRDKRASAVHCGMPWRTTQPVADGTIGQSDRRHAAYFYSGLAATALAGTFGQGGGPPWIPGWLMYDLADNRTLTVDDLGFVHYIKCSTAAELTMPVAIEGRPTMFVNYGSAVITLKTPSGAVMATLRTRQRTDWVLAWPDGDGLIGWPTKLVVYGASGEMYLLGDITFRDSAKGTIYKDAADGTLVKVTANAGAQVTTDSGSSSEADPSESEA